MGKFRGPNNNKKTQEHKFTTGHGICDYENIKHSVAFCELVFLVFKKSKFYISQQY